MMATKKRGLGLGRGLDVLLGAQEPETSGDAKAGEGELQQLAITSIAPGKYQPRRTFDEGKLDELAASIRTQGVIEPVIVRALGRGRHELIAGERRWRAAQRAGLTEIPALVRTIDDRTAVAIALIENIQREDLSALEEAQSLARLIEEFKLTHQQIADAIGRSRASVSNLLRLLELPAEIRSLLDERKLDMGHARALLSLAAPRAVALARETVAKDWSVRELEDAVRRAGTPTKKATPAKARADANISALESSLSERLGTRVAISHGRNGRGKLVIHYHSLDELDGILEKIR
ncbi:MAG TPA: ParB/RepB/Spo0J family partition protein [Dokdonella sp.]|uniref:ParB/RepB/Spo0J family partition protein n=1 Tax=Dokdonella sp. TaxID=2291710 RepID=UPI0025C1D96F|nr:ParB/RepB/Spo0J family partition protein [Dokdonella sp.]MBX3691549.1 ParB/RepB/Spo0J family partition protein [Dokdonella sp.]HNR92129.1 ParB/RepB/Spo0J family partition protein [Dokdonella sp.]